MVKTGNKSNLRAVNIPFFLFLYYNRDGDIMKSILVEIQCDCGFHTYRKSETLVLSDFEVDIRKALMENTYFTIRCPRCGKEIIFLHPFAYVDKKHHFIILLKPKQAFCEDDHHLYHEDTRSRKRIVFDPKAIKEKLCILEDDFDDRVIEIMKEKLRLQLERQGREIVDIVYQDRHEDSLWFLVNQEPLAVLYENYQSIENSLEKEKHDCYLAIDGQWAKAWLALHK